MVWRAAWARRRTCRSLPPDRRSGRGACREMVTGCRDGRCDPAHCGSTPKAIRSRARSSWARRIRAWYRAAVPWPWSLSMMLSAISPATPIFRTAAESEEASILGIAGRSCRRPKRYACDKARHLAMVLRRRKKTSSLPRSEVRHRERLPRAKMHGIMRCKSGHDGRHVVAHCIVSIASSSRYR